MPDDRLARGGGVPDGNPVVRWTTRVLDWLAAIVLFALVVMTCVDVVGRYLLNAPLAFTTDVTRLMLVVVVFAVLPAVCRVEGHVSVDLLDAWFPRRLVNARQFTINMFGAVAFAFIADRLWFVANRAAGYGDRTDFVGIPTAPFYYYISVLMALASLALLLNALRYLRGRGPMSPPRNHA